MALTIDDWFWFSGVALNLAGGLALLGIASMAALNQIVRTTGTMKIIMQWYWDKLHKDSGRSRG